MAEAHGIEEARLDAAAAEIARIPELRPEEWKTADQWRRKAVLQEVNRIMGRALEMSALPLEFKPLPESRDHIELGRTTEDGAYTFIHDKFLLRKRLAAGMNRPLFTPAPRAWP
jgi:hypothetical protein